VFSVAHGLNWFDAHLKGERSGLRDKPVRLFILGADEWREMDDWPPPADETRYFLHGDGQLSPSLPEFESPADLFRYNPADPTPAAGNLSLMAPPGPMDNRLLEARSDVLCYTTPPLAEDVEVIGLVRLELFVRSSQSHTDFVGRLCEVHPDGRSINVCEGLFRIRPDSGEPQEDSSLRIEVNMWATAKLFRRGHSIRLQVASSAHPRWYRNLGTGEPVSSASRMVTAEQTVYHDRTHPSALVLPVTGRI
jgi:putative CocE/NonD family hydrolase